VTVVEVVDVWGTVVVGAMVVGAVVGVTVVGGAVVDVTDPAPPNLSLYVSRALGKSASVPPPQSASK